MRALPLSAGLLCWAVALYGQDTSSHRPSALTWGPAPAVFPAGARMAVVRGDPGKAGLFTIQLAMPDGYRIPPHFHPTDEQVAVKQGILKVGMGDTLDVSRTNPLAAGQEGKVPAGHHHFAVAEGATVVAVTAMGPFAMTYVNPQDDPQRKLARP
jgi:hypothetical protein